MINKKHLVLMVFLSLAATSLVFAEGKKDTSTAISIRIAEQVPNLITPGVWDGQAFSLNSSIYDYLVEMDAKTGELAPALAESWKTTDGKTWTLALRKGVKFHDGSDFTAEDAKYSIERTQDPAVGHLKAQDFAVVESVQTPDAYTLVLKLSAVRPTFMYQLAEYNMAMLSSTYDYAMKGETAPMGTGAFMIKAFVPKESALLVKNPNFWQSGYPKADELKIYFVPDIDSSIAMLEAGKVDVVPQISPLIKQRLSKMAGYKVVSPYQEQRFIALAADRAPFDDNKVRLALKYTMDPVILAKACQGTLGTEIFYNETPIMNKLSQYTERPLRGRDIAKAKALLTEAGHPNGIKVELFYASDHPYSPALAQTVKELAAPAGFDISLKGFPRDIYLAQHWMNGPMLITGWGGRVDPSVLLNLAYISTGPWNESHMADPELDSLTAKILMETNDKARQALYDRVQELFYERGTVINVQVPYLVALSDKVEDFRQPITMITQYKYTYLKGGK